MTIQSYKLVIDGLNKLGQVFQPLDKTPGVEVPYPPGGVSVGKYSVPSGKKFIAQTLSLHACNQDRCVENTSWGINFGEVGINVGGVKHHEFRIQGTPIILQTDPTAASDESVSPQYNCNQTFSFGDGWICPGATALLVNVNPAWDAFTRWVVSIYGIESGADRIVTGKKVTVTTAAAQEILNYTPSFGWTILGMNISAEMAAQNIGMMRLEFCGFHCFETGRLGMGESAPVPYSPDGCCGTLYGQGLINIPLTDIEFQQGEFLQALAHAISVKNDWFQMMIFGKEETVGGAGGLLTHPGMGGGMRG